MSEYDDDGKKFCSPQIPKRVEFVTRDFKKTSASLHMIDVIFTLLSLPIN